MEEKKIKHFESSVDTHKKAKKNAASKGMTLKSYIKHLVDKDK